LKKLDLSFNLFKSIKFLGEFDFAKLESLNISNNEITDVNDFKKVNFKEI
jgi:Leucine-rich repeat (LRR) protein